MFSTNNFNCQVKVKGYKLMETVNSNDLTIKVYSDGIRVMYAVTGTTTIISGILTKKVTYKPLSNVTFELNPSQNMGARLRIAPDGGMQYYNNTGSSTSVEAQSSAIAFLATPLY